MGWNKLKYLNSKRLIEYDFRMGYIQDKDDLRSRYDISLMYDDFEYAKAVDDFCNRLGFDVTKKKNRVELKPVDYVG